MTGNTTSGGTSRRWNPWRVAGWGAGAALLLLPLVAMHFTDEVKWDLADFAFAAALVGSVGLGYEWVVRKTRSRAWRAAAAVALAAAFLLLWAHAAVDLVGGAGGLPISA